ncbi:MAG: chloride channel protein [Sedimentisphaerales bacterium]|nr:chloride channel protein [Sedimentisphaerales bacterium]
MTEPQTPRNKAGRLYEEFSRFLKRLGFPKESVLIVLAVAIGALTGLGSVLFTMLIDLAHSLCYGESGIYGGRWFFLLILPAAGGLLVGIITFYFAREARGHGVPEVMDAIARRDGRIRGRVAIAKAVASALTIGTGGSAGTEGPIIQIGSALGSRIGQQFKVARHNMPILVGCGAAAGISAIFHAPIAGVLFALEIFLRELKFKTFSPVLMASVISSVVVSAILGENVALFPLVHNEAVYSFKWFELGNYVLLGLVCAGVGVLFIRLLYGTEDFFEWLNIHPIFKPVIGAVVLGLLGVITVKVFAETGTSEPGIFGNGYRLIGRCIGAGISEGQTGFELGIGVLVVLLLLKVLATCFTLGSGGSGGVFAPSLFMGAMAGYAVGVLMQKWNLFSEIHPEMYALVGMASVVAATTHAPMAAIVILFEMTRNYQVILPVMFSATIATAVARLIYRESIYTLKLRRRGVHFEMRADTAVLRSLTVSSIMQPECEIIYHDTPLQDVINRAVRMELADFVVMDHNRNYIGLLVSGDLRRALLYPESIPFLLAGELVHDRVPTVTPEESLDEVLHKFAHLEVDCMPVCRESDDKDFIGLVTRAALMRRYQQELHGHKEIKNH